MMNETVGSSTMASVRPLIATSRVDGIVVFARDGSKLGTVHNLIIDQRTGQVAYVIVSTGGFLGLGQAYHPLPWSAFTYNDKQEGYVVTIDKQMLGGAPSFRPDNAPQFDDAYGRRISDYYAGAGI